MIDVNTLPSNYIYHEHRQKLLNMPPGDERDQALAAMLQQRTAGTEVSASFAKSYARADQLSETVEKTSNLKHFCSKNSVPVELGQRLLSETSEFVRSHDFSAVNNVSFAKPQTFTSAEALQMVSDAFRAFSPDMAVAVDKAGHDGRIVFNAPFNSAHQGAVHQTQGTPDEIEKLPESLTSQPYISTHGDPKALTLDDVYVLAHECGHLAATQRYISCNGKNKPEVSYPLEETYALLGTELLHDSLARKYKNEPELALQAEHAYVQNQRSALVEVVRLAQAEHELSELHNQFKAREFTDHTWTRVKDTFKRSRIDKSPEKQAYDAYALKVAREPYVGRLLDPEAFYSLSYPLAAQAALELHGRWKKGHTNLPGRLEHVMESDLNYGGAMTRLGIDITKPDFIRAGLSGYEEQEKALLKNVRVSRGQAQLIERKLREAARSADIPDTGFSSTKSTQVGSVVKTDILRDNGKDVPPHS